jgi:multidrug efflux pump subunit AcrA (membrane-fusion protein)
MSDISQYEHPPSGGSNLTKALLGGAIAAVLVANVYLYIQLSDLKTKMVAAQDTTQAEIEVLKENNTTMSAAQREKMASLQADLANARREANSQASQVKKEALSYTEEKAQKLEQEQKAQAQKVSGDIAQVNSQVKEVDSRASEKIAATNSDVSNVKSQVESTKTELNKTIGDLKKVTGDLGITSGYVATNGKEISMLRALGERNIFEFKLAKTKTPQRIGDVSLLLKKVDEKKNRFTFELTADDKLVEKKDRTINEPIQFMTSKAKQPYEIVVNHVSKDLISGYLATPKVTEGR